jgi:acetyl esterase
MHGGGFIMGSAENDDLWCRRVANAVPCLVVNIDYRLAPEHKFPAALEECYDVVRYLHSNAAKLRIDPARIAVGGQSAGANLAAGICLLARDRREFPIVCQVLNYPPLDMTIDPYSKANLDKILTARMQILFNACYLRNEDDALNPLVSPLLVQDLAGLPDALIITAELDPLRPEAEQYAKRLAVAGVNATCEMFAGCMHAFTHFGPKAAARAAQSLTCEQLKTAFRKSR